MRACIQEAAGEVEHIYMSIHAYMHAYIYMHTCMHTYMHTCMHTYMQEAGGEVEHLCLIEVWHTQV